MSNLDHPHVAPLWKLSLASWVDSLPWLAFLTVLVLRRNRSRQPLILAILMADLYEVAAHTMFGRTVGQRVFNIRVVSQKTGRSPSLKQSLVRLAVLRVPNHILTWWPKSPQRKQTESNLKVVNLEIEQLKLEHRDDRVALNQAVLELYEERQSTH